MTIAEFIESQEGREHLAYPDPKPPEGEQPKGYSIGVGHYLTKKELDSGIIHLPSGDADWKAGLSDAQIDELLAQDIGKIHDHVKSLVRCQTLNESQWCALIDFAFNEGQFPYSTLLKKINANMIDDDTIQVELDKWNLSGGLVNQGLIRRRKLEGDLWAGRTIATFV